MKKLIILMAASAFVLGGCVTYTYGGKKYETQEEILALQEKDNAKRADAAVPLAKPLSNKKLIYMVPSYDAIMSAQAKMDAAKGVTRNQVQQGDAEIKTKGNMLRHKMAADLIRKRNIYKEVEFVQTSSYSISPSANENEDIVFTTCNLSSDGRFSCGAFYMNKKYGKQVFAFDKSSADLTENDKALLQAYEALAIRE